MKFEFFKKAALGTALGAAALSPEAKAEALKASTVDASNKTEQAAPSNKSAESTYTLSNAELAKMNSTEVKENSPAFKLALTKEALQQAGKPAYASNIKKGWVIVNQGFEKNGDYSIMSLAAYSTEKGSVYYSIQFPSQKSPQELLAEVTAGNINSIATETSSGDKIVVREDEGKAPTEIADLYQIVLSSGVQPEEAVRILGLSNAGLTKETIIQAMEMAIKSPTYNDPAVHKKVMDMIAALKKPASSTEGQSYAATTQ